MVLQKLAKGTKAVVGDTVLSRGWRFDPMSFIVGGRGWTFDTRLGASLRNDPCPLAVRARRRADAVVRGRGSEQTADDC